MLRTERWPRQANEGLFATVWILLVLVAALLQVGAVVVWWAVAVTSPLASVAAVVASIVLVAGLVAEHLFTEVAVNGPETSVPPERLATLGLIEAAAWVTWLLLADHFAGVRGLALAGLALLALLVVKHSIEDDVLRNADEIAEDVDYGTAPYSAVAALGATLWLSLVSRGDLMGVELDAVGLAGVSPVAAGVAALGTALFVSRMASVVYTRS